jgi:hypothetical protein
MRSKHLFFVAAVVTATGLTACSPAAVRTETRTGGDVGLSSQSDLAAWAASEAGVAEEIGDAFNDAADAIAVGAIDEALGQCQRLDRVITGALAGPGAPDAELDTLLTNAYLLLQDGAELCVEGLTTFDTDAINASAAKFEAGTVALDLATDRLSELLG